MTLQDRIDQEVEDLRTTRDELRVRLHLGKLEAKEMWEKLEKDWEGTESKLKTLKDAGQDVAEDVGEAARQVVDELKEGYEKLRRLL
jgi:hypothetical protein